MKGRAAVSFVRLLHEFLADRGFDSEQVLGEPTPPEDPVAAEYITIRHWVNLLERANAVLNMPAMGLTLGASICASHLGVLGYLTRSCSTLGQALNRMNDYEHLVYETSPGRLRFDLKGLVVEWGTENGRPGQLADECAMAIIVAYGRELAGSAEVRPIELRFVNPEPPSLQPYLDFFQCPVSFNAPKTVMRIGYGTLARRIPHHEPTLMALLEQQARERLCSLPPTDPFMAKLRQVVVKLLPDGKATLAACALRLHCSSRTLQRRLSGLDLSFQTVLDEVRLQMAGTYMDDPRLKLAEMALLLGFADQASFTHAFTRWTGMPPARWRACMHETPVETAVPGDELVERGLLGAG